MDIVSSAENDEAIHQSIVQGLTKSSLNTSKIDVTVLNGMVFLRGQVDSFDDFIKIEEFVGHVDGVVEIRNELQTVA